MDTVFLGLTTLDVVQRVPGRPSWGTKQVVESTELVAGGPAANAAVAAAAILGSATLVTGLGASAAARTCRDDLESHGVRIIDLVPHQNREFVLPVSSCVVEADGTRTVFSTSALTSRLHLNDAARQALSHARALMLDGHHPVAAGLALAHGMPWLQVDPRVAALVCMAAIFTGASRAFLTSVVFAFETTQQPHGLLPLLGACAAAYLVSGLLMRNTIMTEKIARRGVRVPSEYASDYLDQIMAGDACSRDVVSLQATQTLGDVRQWLMEDHPAARHQGFPVLDANNQLLGVVTRRDLTNMRNADSEMVGSLIHRSVLAVREDHSLREAADHMVEADVGRVIVLGKDAPHRMVGILTRGDLLSAHAQRLREAREISRYRPRRS